MVKKIYAVWVYVHDLEQSRLFYTKALGLNEKLRDGTWLEFDLGQTSFAIYERPKEKSALKPQKTRIMFQTDDIEDTASDIRAAGGKIIGSVRNESYGQLLTFEDPNGHWLELFQPNSEK